MPRFPDASRRIRSLPPVARFRVFAPDEKNPVSVSPENVNAGEPAPPKADAVKKGAVEVALEETVEVEMIPATVRLPPMKADPATEKREPGVLVPTPTFPEVCCTTN